MVIFPYQFLYLQSTALYIIAIMSSNLVHSSFTGYYVVSWDHVWMWELDCEEGWAPKNWCFWTVVLQKTLESSLDCREIQPVHSEGDPTSPFWRRSALGFLWKESCQSWNSSTLATSCEELTHWKRLRCWEGLQAGGKGDDRGWDGWMASLIQWMRLWVNSGSWWWTGRPGMLQFMGSQRVGHDWATELNWTEQWYSHRDSIPLATHRNIGQ